MHIVQLVPSLLTGGMETMAVHLACWLQERGHSVEAVFFEQGGALVGELTRHGVAVRRLHLAPYVWRLYPRRLISHLAGRNDIVLHGHMHAWYKGAAATRWLDAACVCTQHSWEEPRLRQEWREMRGSARRTDAAVGVSDEVRRCLVEQLGIPRERAYHIPNGVPDIYQAHRPDLDWGVPIPKGAPVIGMVARLAWPKDPGTLVEAVLLVRRRLPGVHLVLVGGGPDEVRLRDRIRELNAVGFVHLLGERRDVPQLLHHVDVFVLSSLSEGHSMAMLEAMSARRAIVATRVGGNSQLLDDGRCGILSPPAEPQPMAEAILRLLLDPVEAGRFAELARLRFLENFSVDHMGEAYLALYREVLARRGGRREANP